MRVVRFPAPTPTYLASTRLLGSVKPQAAVHGVARRERGLLQLPDRAPIRPRERSDEKEPLPRRGVPGDVARSKRRGSYSFLFDGRESLFDFSPGSAAGAAHPPRTEASRYWGGIPRGERAASHITFHLLHRSGPERETDFVVAGIAGGGALERESGATLGPEAPLDETLSPDEPLDETLGPDEPRPRAGSAATA